MKRFNLLLSKEQYNYLNNTARNSGCTKSSIIRSVLQNFIIKGFDQKDKPVGKSWSFASNITYNFQLHEDEVSWLKKMSEIYACSKGEIVRCILELELKKIRMPLFSNGIKSFKKADSVVVNNISLLLQNKAYLRLNKYLVNLNYSEVVNIGNPEFFVKVLNELKKNYEMFSPELKILKAKMHWFCGQRDWALMELDDLENVFIQDKNIILKGKIVKGEILADLGMSLQASRLLTQISGELKTDLQSNYSVKLYNKLGLSLFYNASLIDVKAYYENALTLATKPVEIAIANRYLGSIYHALENFDEAQKYYSLSYEIFRSNPEMNLDEYARLLITYAELQINTANWIKASKMILEGVAICERINHMPNLCWALRLLADTELYFNSIDKSLLTIERSIELAKMIDCPSYLRKAYARKAKYCMMKKDYTKAYDMLEKSRIFEKLCLGKDYQYNSILKWQNYLNSVINKSIDFSSLHNQSTFLKKKHHSIDESATDYVLGYLYLQSKDPIQKEMGKVILKRVLYHAMDSGSKQLQFAVETSMSFNQFIFT